jgi:hypothetical protein
MTEGWVIEADNMSSRTVDQVLSFSQQHLQRLQAIQVDHNRKLSERLITADSRHHPPMLEPHLVVRFRVNAIAWLLLPISIPFYTFKGREGTRRLIRKLRGHVDCRKLETGSPSTPSHCF